MSTEWSINQLKGYKENNKATCVLIWIAEDVFGRAKDLDIKCTEAEADGILEYMERKQDATLGVTWDTIDYHLENLERERAKNENK
jgi:hypothetical protein